MKDEGPTQFRRLPAQSILVTCWKPCKPVQGLPLALSGHQLWAVAP